MMQLTRDLWDLRGSEPNRRCARSSLSRSGVLAICGLMLFVAAVVTPSVSWSGTADFVRGDVNSDTVMDISDVVFLLSYLVGTETLQCLDAADLNDNGSINIGDGVYLLHVLFEPGFPNPPGPYPACGADPTNDTLSCVSFPACP